MRQRVMIAMALACRPKLLIADEPTTALDVTVQAQILTIIKDLQTELGMAIIFITHDMGVVAEMADDVVVMRQGRKVEEGPVDRVFSAPRHPYTRALLSAVPRLGSMAGRAFPVREALTVLDGDTLCKEGETREQDTADYAAPPLLQVRDLDVHFDVARTFWGGPRIGPVPSTASACRSGRARRWRSSANPAAANPPSAAPSSSCRMPIRARCCLTENRYPR